MQVRFAIHTAQTVDGDTAHSDVCGVGRYERVADGFRLRYTDEGDGDTVFRTVRFAADTVTVEQRGALQSTLLLRRSADWQGEYATPYGSFAVTTRTHRLDSTLTETGGEVWLGYTLTLGGGEVENTLHITVQRM